MDLHSTIMIKGSSRAELASATIAWVSEGLVAASLAPSHDLHESSAMASFRQTVSTRRTGVSAVSNSNLLRG